MIYFIPCHQNTKPYSRVVGAVTNGKADQMSLNCTEEQPHLKPRQDRIALSLDRVCLVRQWAWLQHVLKMSSFKKREKALRRTHRERAQVGYGGTDES